MFPDRRAVYSQTVRYQQVEVQHVSTTVGFQPVAELSRVKGRVEKLLEERKLTLRWLQERVGITKTGYREMWERESVRVVVLVKMAEALGVSVDALLSATDELVSVVADPAAPYGKPKYLEERVAELEEQVKQLRHDLRRKG
jgi:DNA-binding Xre family transcriptional regulator